MSSSVGTALEQRLGELVGVKGGGVEELLPPFSGLGRELGRDGLDADGLALRAVEVEGLHGDEVDEALKAPSRPIGICMRTALWPSFSAI